jgi:hypothetical protein
MELTAKQYEIAVNNAAEISQILLNMEDGKYILALFSELLGDMLNAKDISGAILVIQKLCEATEVPFEQPEPGRNDVAMWISLFSEAWDEVLEESIF